MFFIRHGKYIKNEVKSQYITTVHCMTNTSKSKELTTNFLPWRKHSMMRLSVTSLYNFFKRSCTHSSIIQNELNLNYLLHIKLNVSRTSLVQTLTSCHSRIQREARNRETTDRGCSSRKQVHNFNFYVH